MIVKVINVVSSCSRYSRLLGLTVTARLTAPSRGRRRPGQQPRKIVRGPRLEASGFKVNFVNFRPRSTGNTVHRESSG